MREKQSAIELFAGIFLAGLGTLAAEYAWLKFGLVGIGGALLLHAIWKTVRELMPTLLTEPDDVRAAAVEIYDEASRHGGRLITTHVRPQHLNANDDFALPFLRKAQSHLEYERLIVISDRAVEADWIRNTLAHVTDQITCTVYFLKKRDAVPALAWAAIPRLNIILYNRGGLYMSFLGLDRLKVDSDGRDINVAFKIRGRLAFDMLSSYFRNLVSDLRLTSVQSLEQYRMIDSRLRDARISSIYTAATRVAEETEAILHVGIFGSVASRLNELRRDDRTVHDSDIDLLLVVEDGTTDNVRDSLSKAFAQVPLVDIVWGDDPTYFYHFRVSGRLTVDIEIHEKGATFYRDHPLLGYSIFASYHTVFSRDDATLLEVLKIPVEGVSTTKRLHIAADDRNGYRDFLAKLESAGPEVDPRRLLSISVRNLVWALTGLRPWSTVAALNYLERMWPAVSTVPLSSVRALLNSNTNETRARLSANHELLSSLLRDFLAFTQISAPYRDSADDTVESSELRSRTDLALFQTLASRIASAPERKLLAKLSADMETTGTSEVAARLRIAKTKEERIELEQSLLSVLGKLLRDRPSDREVRELMRRYATFIT